MIKPQFRQCPSLPSPLHPPTPTTHPPSQGGGYGVYPFGWNENTMCMCCRFVHVKLKEPEVSEENIILAEFCKTMWIITSSPQPLFQVKNWSIKSLPLSDWQQDSRTSAAGMPTTQQPQATGGALVVRLLSAVWTTCSALQPLRREPESPFEWLTRRRDSVQNSTAVVDTLVWEAGL